MEYTEGFRRCVWLTAIGDRYLATLTQHETEKTFKFFLSRFSELAVYRLHAHGIIGWLLLLLRAAYALLSATHLARHSA